MRIGIVTPGGVDRSGSERVIPCLLWLIERLARGHDVQIFAADQEPSAGTWPLLGATVHNAGPRPRRLRMLGAMLAEHRRARFDVVHAFWANPSGVVAAAFGRLTGVPVALTLPGGDLTNLPDIGYGGRLTRRGRMWAALALRGADRVVVPSRWMADRAAALGIATEHIRYGVALDRFPPIPPRRRTSPVLRLLHAANLNPVKDQPTLLRAMRRLADRGVAFELDIVGFDTLNGAIHRLTGELSLDAQVRFHGPLPHDRLPPLFAAADVLVMSSRHETVPIVALEAAVAGVPTVATAVGQIADWSPDAAMAVPIGDAEALAAAIARVAADEELRLRLAYAAQADAIEHDADAFAAATLALYRSVNDPVTMRRKRL